MSKRLFIFCLITVFAVVTAVTGTAGLSHAGKPTVAPMCKQCHQAQDKVIRGNFVSITESFKTMQVAVGSLVWVVKYGDDLKLTGAAKLAAIPKDKEVALTYTGEEKTPYAVSLSVKPPAKIPAEKLMKLDDMKKLVDMGPEKGRYLLFDSRPAPKYNEGHIPTAISFPQPAFDKVKDKVLPKEKDKLLIFYCGGVTCRMSPDAARRTEALGYTNTKIFLDGMPAWKKSGNLVVSATAGLKDFIEKDIAHVLVDLRNAKAAKKGFIKGAVSMPAKDLAAAKDKFPADKSAPIILYSDKEDAAAYTTVSSWGYKNTSVLSGGIAVWKKAGGKLAKGKLTTTISYVPKPRPGEISIEEFKALASISAPDKIILDVRDNDQAMNGMLKGAINIPAGEIKDRLKELPKDKEIITHCNTGVMAESAYDDLKEAGYKVRFLNAIIQIDKDGKHEITKK
ncbi:MAG: sulfurtransferase [Nitrospira bacterium HGW-Nitrospira-1]|nr:MAG: sulfurtransferase [Nitrospira bacterium HGW-Nitrospira-1]